MGLRRFGLYDISLLLLAANEVLHPLPPTSVYENQSVLCVDGLDGVIGSDNFQITAFEIAKAACECQSWGIKTLVELGLNILQHCSRGEPHRRPIWHAEIVPHCQIEDRFSHLW